MICCLILCYLSLIIRFTVLFIFFLVPWIEILQRLLCSGPLPTSTSKFFPCSHSPAHGFSYIVSLFLITLSCYLWVLVCVRLLVLLISPIDLLFCYRIHYLYHVGILDIDLRFLGELGCIYFRLVYLCVVMIGLSLKTLFLSILYLVVMIALNLEKFLYYFVLYELYWFI